MGSPDFIVELIREGAHLLLNIIKTPFGIVEGIVAAIEPKFSVARLVPVSYTHLNASTGSSRKALAPISRKITINTTTTTRLYKTTLVSLLIMRYGVDQSRMAIELGRRFD